jgi:hypothetical protein
MRATVCHSIFPDNYTRRQIGMLSLSMTNRVLACEIACLFVVAVVFKCCMFLLIASIFYGYNGPF